MSKELTNQEKIELLEILEERFLKNMHRHPEMKWEDVLEKITKKKDSLWTLYQMEKTGGEPDIVGESYVFIDCSKESPKGRRSICYDREALDARKKNKPENDAITMAQEMGIELLNEKEYRDLQMIEAFDLKTSSWVQTTDKIRKLGGALYCDRRYDTVFVYHNGADSYYASRGFRGKLKIA